MNIKEKISSLPNKPGIYQYKDSAGEIIYIGKAKNLKKRVSSYFAKEQTGKTYHLVKHISSIDFIVTPSEVEALLLEAQLIRKHQPKYNVDLKGGVRYAWIVLTDELFPRLLSARKRTLKGEYFGPFVQGTLRRTLLTELQKRFFIRTCRILPKRACLRYHIGLCKAPCINKQSTGDYQKNVEKVRQYLSGKNDILIKELEQEMNTHIQTQEYEQAKVCKEQIDSLSYLQQQILVQQDRSSEEDVINYVLTRQDDQTIMQLQVFSYRNGVLQGKQSFKLLHDENAFDEFLKRYYEMFTPPKHIIVPHEPEDDSLAEYLSRQTTYTVTFTVPQRGLKKQLLDLVTENLHAQQTQGQRLALALQELLDTPTPVHTVETFDISHHAGTSMVGSMVHFKDGKALKNNYRRFKINTVIDTVDDFRAMKEVITRRYTRVKEGKEVAPDLIVVDGGAIQVKFAKDALDELNLAIPLVGLAKKFEEIYYPDSPEPVRYDKKLEAMKVLIQSRDEAHRFGVAYHRLLKSKKTLEK